MKSEAKENPFLTVLRARGLSVVKGGKMNPEIIAQILAAFVDELNEGKEPKVFEYLRKYPEYTEELEPLLKFTQWIETTIRAQSLTEPDNDNSSLITRPLFGSEWLLN